MGLKNLHSEVFFYTGEVRKITLFRTSIIGNTNWIKEIFLYNQLGILSVKRWGHETPSAYLGCFIMLNIILSVVQFTMWQRDNACTWHEWVGGRWIWANLMFIWLWLYDCCVTSHIASPTSWQRKEIFSQNISARSKTPYKAQRLTINFQIQLLRGFDDILLDISIAVRNNSCPGPTVNWFIQKASLTKSTNCPISIFT